MQGPHLRPCTQPSIRTPYIRMHLHRVFQVVRRLDRMDDAYDLSGSIQWGIG